MASLKCIRLSPQRNSFLNNLYPIARCDTGSGPQAVMATVPLDVDNLVFPNYESMPERDDVADPFIEACPGACPCPNLCVINPQIWRSQRTGASAMCPVVAHFLY